MSQLTLLDPAPTVSPLPLSTDPWLSEGRVTLYHGDCIEVMARMPANSCDGCVTDPPYGLGFMGQAWDTFKPELAETNARKAFQVGAGRMRDSENPNLRGRSTSPAMSPSQIEYDRGLEGQRAFQRWTESWAREAFRVLKPGAHLVVCGAPRSAHRMFSGIEDAGFEIRDSFIWSFAQGFPKSHNFGCKCRENPLPYNHEGIDESNDSVRGVREGSDDAAVVAEEDQAPDVLSAVQRSSPGRGLEAARAQGPSGMEAGGCGVVHREDDRREQSSVAGGELHRTREGLPDGQATGSSEGQSERLRAGAYSGGREDIGAAPEARRGSAPQGSRQGQQRSGESEDLQLPSGTLDGGAPDRSARCERCGGLTAAKGWGTALKPGHEPICLARKPFEGTVEENFKKWGLGALNIDACRLETHGAGDRDPRDGNGDDIGRWPVNVLLDAQAASRLDAQAGERTSGANPTKRGSDKFRKVFGKFKGSEVCEPARGAESGGASRFFFVAKPSRLERDFGCEDLPMKTPAECTERGEGSAGITPYAGAGRSGGGRNPHPTVKPVSLMRWLLALTVPPGGVVLEPFLGSGTTGMAAVVDGYTFIGIEREEQYLYVAKARIQATAAEVA